MKTPVVLVFFNRPGHLEKVWNQIAKAAPERVFLISDGPRPGNKADVNKVKKARDLVEKVTWTCSVQTKYANENLGCRKNVSEGLSWVFSQVEEAIILEDDCVPNLSFFQFAEELLERYRNEPKVVSICGYQPSIVIPSDDSYIFSRYPLLWGWATWRRAWRHYQEADLIPWHEMWDETRISVSKFNTNKSVLRFWQHIPREVTSSWGYQWIAACLRAGGLTILPTVNLVSNVGGLDGTHTRFVKRLPLPSRTIDFPLKHPSGFERHLKCERKLEIDHFEASCLKLLAFSILQKLRRTRPSVS
jgi:hypothetical protein